MTAAPETPTVPLGTSTAYVVGIAVAAAVTAWVIRRIGPTLATPAPVVLVDQDREVTEYADPDDDQGADE